MTRVGIRDLWKLHVACMILFLPLHTLAFRPSQPLRVLAAIRYSLSTTSTKMSNDSVVFESRDLIVHYLPRTVASTQEEARRLLVQNTDGRNLAVIADNQSNGRGTNGREWQSTNGNLFLTCALRSNMIPMSSITLLPLAVGVAVAQQLEPLVIPRPVVKWPNDVLINDQKVSGVLIENDQGNFWLVGIGINIQHAPETLIPHKEDFATAPRQATCIRDAARANISIPTAVELGTSLAVDLVRVSASMSSGDGGGSLGVVEQFRSWTRFGQEYQIRETGETVKTIGLESDGQLRVVGRDGKERLLVSDYLF